MLTANVCKQRCLQGIMIVVFLLIIWKSNLRAFFFSPRLQRKLAQKHVENVRSGRATLTKRKALLLNPRGLLVFHWIPSVKQSPQHWELCGALLSTGLFFAFVKSLSSNEISCRFTTRANGRRDSISLSVLPFPAASCWPTAKRQPEPSWRFPGQRSSLPSAASDGDGPGRNATIKCPFMLRFKQEQFTVFSGL